MFLYIRGEMALAHERVGQALVDAYAKGYVGNDIMGCGWSLDIVLHWGAGAYVVGEETALIESLEGKRAFPRIKPPVLPGGQGPLLPADDREQRRDASRRCRGSSATAARSTPRYGAGRSTGTRIMCLSGHVKKPGNYEVEAGKITFRDLIFDPELGGGIRDGGSVKAFVPGGGSAPWLFEEHLDLKLDPGDVAAEGTMLGSGAVVVMDQTDVHGPGRLEPRALLQPRVLRAVHAVPRGRQLAREDHVPHRARRRPAWRTSTCCSTSARRSRPGRSRTPATSAKGVAATPWPYRMTTICFVGPSAVVPMHSALTRFPEEFVAHIEQGCCPSGKAAHP